MHIPHSYNGIVGVTIVDAVGAVCGGFAQGSGSIKDHRSTLLGLYSSTWMPMSLLAARAISVCFEAVLSYLKLNPDNFNNRDNAEAFYTTFTTFVMTYFQPHK